MQQFKSRVVAKKNSVHEGHELLFASRLTFRPDSGAIYKVALITLLLQTIQPVSAEGTSQDAAKRSLASVVIAPGSSKATSSTKTTASKTSYSKKALRNKVHQSYPRTHMEKGLYLKQKNDPNGALLEFLKATQADPHQVKGFYEQALIFRARGYRKLAESSLEQALAIDPKYNEARILLATVQLEQGNLGGAVQELSRSLGLDSSTASNKDLSKDSASSVNSVNSVSIASIASLNSLTSLTSLNSPKSVNSVNSVNSSNSAHADSSRAASPIPQQSSGLLSIDVPAILQSIHGVIKTPSWLESLTGMAPSPSPSPSTPASPTTSTSSTSAAPSNASTTMAGSSEDARKGEAGNSVSSSDSKIASFDAKKSEIDQSEEQGKKKHRKSKPKKEKKETKEKKSKKEKTDKSLLSLVPSSNSNSDTTRQNSSSQQKVTESNVPIEQKSAPSNANSDDATILANIKREANSEGIETNSQKSTSAPSGQQTVLGDSPAFNVNKNTRPVTSILSTILAASQGQGSTAQKKTPSTPKVKLDDDDWAKKLKNYAEHGASSLKNGEAFMFSEDTGEASLFLADGTTIRRIVAQPKDSTEVIRERRPDISHAEDVLYGLSLLGKLIPKFDTTPVTNTESVAQSSPEPAGNFRGDNLMTSTQSFWGWVKSVCKF